MKPFFGIALSALLLLASTLAAAQIQHGFYWSQATGMIDLGTLGGTNSFATAINESGIVVGAAFTAGDTCLQAFKWTSSSGMQPLADFGSCSFANAINRAGQIVGYAGAVGGNHAVLWDSDGTIHDLGTLLGGSTSWATGINDEGVVSGTSYDQSGGLTGFAWSPFHGMQPLVDNRYASEGNGIAREIVGDFVTRSGFYHAALWSLNFGRFDLGTLAPSQNANSFAWAVNFFNQVVGESQIFHNG